MEGKLLLHLTLHSNSKSFISSLIAQGVGNVFVTPPLAVRGKKRLCFISYRNIQGGEDIHWNPLEYIQ